MFKNLLKTALRNISKSIGYSVLNVLGLTLGLTSALFLILYIADELSYDRYHEKSDRIYRVQSHITETDDEFTWIVAQSPFADQVKLDYPEVENVTRFIDFGRALFSVDDIENFEENFFFADTTVFDIFSYNFIHGSAEQSLSRPNDIVLTQTIALKYFGKSNPIGQSMKSGDTFYEVTGVIEDVPRHSHFRFDALVSRLSLPQEFGTWGNFGVFTYLLFPDNVDVNAFEVKIQEMYEKYMATIFEAIGITIEYELIPITKIHLYSDNAQEPEPTGSIIYVYIFALVALFLILIAVMNYMNLATARSAKRAKEVGLRKVVGSGRGALILQFLTESISLTLISLILSTVLMGLLLPSFNHLAGKNFGLDVIYSPIILFSLIGLVILVGIIGGSYPAFYLSRFSPAVAISGESNSGKKGTWLRKILVVIQFSLSIAMIVCTIVVYNQLNFLRDKDRGWDMEEVISLQLPNNEQVAKMSVLKEQLISNPQIKYVSNTNGRIGEGSSKTIFNIETSEGMAQRGVNFNVVDHDFAETMGIEIIEGRDFSPDRPADTLLGVIVNQTLANRFAWDEPLGKKVELGDDNTIRAEVIGVMKDYHQTGMYNEVESLMWLYRNENPIMYIKLSPDNINNTLESIGVSWNKVFPNHPFEYEFLTDRFEDQFGADKNRGVIFTVFTFLAIFIACVGLFGLASFTVERRTKEIGIRKVLGATERAIVALISKEFMILVGVSMIIAFPTAGYFMAKWLNNYTYHSSLNIYVFLVPGLLAILLTGITVSFHAYKAAILNPADSIYDE
ncbi:MAG: FtsX-like permease family protein [Bacteroidetes bacterium]|jgi:putative ABC transport system permease protein|nr:FtsX-like permease family protein [Bacteroidota bacterium]MBT4401713.1 FtsX-like permease family protein [Bacteroidota bacterium]MBT4408216.1 FtsX-like permease family protein [Bacteroidota bacterium]MBT7094827.1 FtsX-like permease family protein [Bacteroidota bacterium]MBT7466591.1 FtsX-like permease family protein [Bacteroidota bacterium]